VLEVGFAMILWPFPEPSTLPTIMAKKWFFAFDIFFLPRIGTEHTLSKEAGKRTLAAQLGQALITLVSFYCA